MTDLFLPYFVLSLLIFLLGLFCVITQKNLIRIIIGIQIMDKAVILNIITAGFYQDNTGTAQAIVMTVILLDAVTAAVLLALVVNVFRIKEEILADDISGPEA